MVGRIANGDQGNVKSNITEKSPFIGREKEINEIIENVKSGNGTKILLVGESGIGKTALLDEIHRRLTEEEDLRNQVFIGYYNKKESLIAPSQFLLYPLTTVLANLAKEAKGSQQIDERIDNTLDRFKRAVIGFATEKGATFSFSLPIVNK